MNTITNVAGHQIQTTVDQSNYIDLIIDFESGELDDEDVVILFQYLVDTGLAWQLQGFYGRTARDLIQAGYVYAANDLNRPGVIDANADVPNLSAGN